MTDGAFFESLGGSLVQSRSTDPEATERVAIEDDVRTFRISTNTLGLGFVEAISNLALLAHPQCATREDARNGHHRPGARGQ